MKRPCIAWMSTKFPLELAQTFELEVYCPESFAAASARKGQSTALLQRAADLGYPADLCSYSRIGLAAAAAGGDDGLPRPDLLLCCDNICSNMVQWYSQMARMLNVPLLLLDFPYRDTPEVSGSQLSYLKGQVRALIDQLAQLTGRPWDEARFAAACRNANASSRAWQAVLDVTRLDPPPLTNLELTDFMPLLVTGRCRPDTAQKLRAAAETLRRRPARPEPKPRRVFFEGTPCWPAFEVLCRALDEHGLLVTADTLTPSLGFAYQDLDGMLRAYCRTVNGSPLEEGVESRCGLCRRYGAEGVLAHYNRSCRPWCGTLPEVERRLSAELGVPVAAFSADQADPAEWNPAQLATRLDALSEQMECRTL